MKHYKEYAVQSHEYIEKQKNNEKKIYIMLSMTGTRFARMLKCFTRCKYTHVSISLDKDLQEMYSFGRRNMRLPMFAGFVQEIPNKGVFQKYDVSCAIYELCINENQYRSIEHMISGFLEEYEHFKYNFMGLPFMFFKIPFSRKRRFVCSQFVAYLLSRSNVVEFENGYTLVRPEDFLQLDMKKVFQGELKDYCIGERMRESMQELVEVC